VSRVANSKTGVELYEAPHAKLVLLMLDRRLLSMRVSRPGAACTRVRILRVFDPAISSK